MNIKQLTIERVIKKLYQLGLRSNAAFTKLYSVMGLSLPSSEKLNKIEFGPRDLMCQLLFRSDVTGLDTALYRGCEFPVEVVHNYIVQDMLDDCDAGITDEEFYNKYSDYFNDLDVRQLIIDILHLRDSINSLVREFDDELAFDISKSKLVVDYLDGLFEIIHCLLYKSSASDDWVVKEMKFDFIHNMRSNDYLVVHKVHINFGL